VLQILAETARLEGVIFQDSKCTQRAVKQLIENWRHSKDLKLELKILKKIQAKIARLAVRFFLVAVLQNALQVNVQISMMAVSRVVTGSIDPQLLFSVVLGLMGLALDFPDMIEAGKLVRQLLNACVTELNDPSNDGQDNLDSQESRAKNKLESQCKEQLWKCRWIFIRYCLYMVVYFVLLVYTLAKLAGFFLCESHLINGDGCAEL